MVHVELSLTRRRRIIRSCLQIKFWGRHLAADGIAESHVAEKDVASRRIFRVKLNNRPWLPENTGKLFCARARVTTRKRGSEGGLHHERQRAQQATTDV
jgi:hypothetical protein